ncbi:hypothetical protein ACH5RR_029937 [Cinchona calisaya]|uniref:ATP-dependent DNA helicase n=1 Tax=Cinchona calisaya TaxID=153742 RepID=A0ABD2YVE7_9GENT
MVEKTIILDFEEEVGQDVDSLINFSQWILDLRDGKQPTYSFEDDDEPSWIKIPDDLLIPKADDPIKNTSSNPVYLRDRAILSPTNDVAHELNTSILPSFEVKVNSALALTTSVPVQTH